MQVHASRQQARMPGRSLHLGQCSTSGQRMADERMPTVVNCQRSQAIPAQDAARRMESAAENVAIERIAVRRALQRADEWIVPPGALAASEVAPCRKVSQRSCVPPERNPARAVQFGVLSADQDVWSPNVNAHVTDMQSSDFARSQTTATGQAQDGQIH